MRQFPLLFLLLIGLPGLAAAQDDSPLVGSEGSGVIQVSITDSAAKPQKPAHPATLAACASPGCPRLQKAAMAAQGAGTQP